MLKINFLSMLKKLILIPTLALICLSMAQAQSAVVPGGGLLSGSGGTVSFTIGQIAIPTISGSNGSISPGVQQPLLSEMVTALTPPNLASFDISIYPNPSYDVVHVKLGQEDSVPFQLMDLRGKTIYQGTLGLQEQRLNLQQLPPASYFLKVQVQGIIKSYIVIKK